MTVLVPWVLWVTAGAMLTLIGAHLLSVGTPPTLTLPTARFVPDGEATAVSRARWPQDIWWLLLRLLALLAAGLALAGVQCAPQRLPVARLLVIDGDARDTSPVWRRVVDSALSASEPLTGVVWRGGAALVRADAFDDALRDSVRRLGASDASSDDRRTLAGALLRARQLAPAASARADSLALHVITRLHTDAASAALPAVRSGWPGYVRVVTVEEMSPEDSTRGPSVRRDVLVLRGAPDDVVAAAYRALGAPVPSVPDSSTVRIVRDTVGAPLTADDSSHARRGGVLVRWARRAVASPRMAQDSLAFTGPSPRMASGVVARGEALIASLRETAPLATGGTASARSTTRVVAWALDGAPAVTEEPLGVGCVRDVAFEAPGGDLLLGPSAYGVLRALAAPCGRASAPERVARISQVVLEPEIVAGTRAASATHAALQITPATESSPWLTRALLASALLLLLLEQWWRRP